MSDRQQSSFEGWAIVELLGHQREIGFVTTEAYGQAVMFRIDVPDLPEREYELTAPEYVDVVENLRRWAPAGSKVKRAAAPARSRLVAPGSLYAINPCTQEVALAALDKTSPRPLILIEVAPGKALAAPEDSDDEDDDEQDGDEYYEGLHADHGPQQVADVVDVPVDYYAEEPAPEVIVAEPAKPVTAAKKPKPTKTARTRRN